jgi:hypothetical protein
MLTFADVDGRILTYPDVCGRMVDVWVLAAGKKQGRKRLQTPRRVYLFPSLSSKVFPRLPRTASHTYAQLFLCAFFNYGLIFNPLYFHFFNLFLKPDVLALKRAHSPFFL